MPNDFEGLSLIGCFKCHLWHDLIWDIVRSLLVNCIIALFFNNDKSIYLTLCTFSFEINESHLSDAKCLIQDVVTPNCGDKRMVQRCTRRSLPNYVVMTSYHWNVRENTVTWHRWMNDKIMWRHARNVVSLRILYKFYFNPCYLFKIRFYWNVR
jgi:hypothetical protein